MSIPETLKYKAKVSQVDSGIKKGEISHVVQNLSTILGSTYILYMKTQSFHWNVVGPNFYSLHKLSEEHYENLGEAVDTLAERIRALGHLAPINYDWYKKFSHIEEEKDYKDAGEMVKQLMVDHEKLSNLLKEGVMKAESANDHATADLYIQRMHFHDKAVWMLHAILGS